MRILRRPLAGHDAGMATGGICEGIGRSFNATTYAARCADAIATLVRDARGLQMQHDEKCVAESAGTGGAQGLGN